MDRVTDVRGEPWQIRPAPGQRRSTISRLMPGSSLPSGTPACLFPVLLETALQTMPAGWQPMSGRPFTSPVGYLLPQTWGERRSASSRHTGMRHPHHDATLKKVATTAARSFRNSISVLSTAAGRLRRGDHVRFLLKRRWQIRSGIRDASRYVPGSPRRHRDSLLPRLSPFPGKDAQDDRRIELFIPDGGPAGLGYIKGTRG